jgi:hypothetical protein
MAKDFRFFCGGLGDFISFTFIEKTNQSNDFIFLCFAIFFVSDFDGMVVRIQFSSMMFQHKPNDTQIGALTFTMVQTNATARWIVFSNVIGQSHYPMLYFRILR